jgi:hypothetical protein
MRDTGLGNHSRAPTAHRDPESKPCTTRSTNHNHTQRGLDNKLPYDPNFAWGDVPSVDKSDSVARVYFQNVNGISSADRFSAASAVGMYADSKSVDILGMAETNLNWNDREIKNGCTRRLREFLGDIKVQASASLVTFGTAYQPGGTAMIIRGRWLGRVIKSNQDPHNMGRWSCTLLLGKQGRKFAIVTAYQVCQQTIARTGGSTAFAQQACLLRQQNRPMDPRHAFIEDLSAFLRELQASDSEILLMLDANEHPEDRHSGIRRLARQLHLIDLHGFRHGFEDEPATFNRGSRRIDFMYGTRAVATAMKAAGIEPFHANGQSDHRGLFVDIDMDKLLGSPSVELTPGRRRSINSRDPLLVAKYKPALMEYLEEHKVERRLADLLGQAEDGLIGAVSMSWKLNAIDRDLTRGMLHAEAKCRGPHRQPWSPALVHARTSVRYWALWCSDITTGNDCSDQRRTEAVGLVLDEPKEPPTFSEARTRLTKARLALKEVIQQAPSLRIAHLEQCAEAQGLREESEKAAYIRKMIRAEQSKDTFARLRRLRGKTITGGSLSTLAVPNGDGGWDRIVDPQMIEDRLFARNHAHFGQATGTPFTTTSIYDVFGRDGTGPMAEAVLNGSEKDEMIDVDHATAVLLDNMKRPHGTKDIDATVAPYDLRSGFQAWSETTSTSPSGRTLSHYRALDSFPEPREEDGPLMGERVFAIIAGIVNLAVQHVVVLERWKTVVSVMLEKIPGNPRLDKLRVIHIFEADLNLTMGILWGRRLLPQAERINELGDEQWGSRKGRMATDVLVQKHMTYSIAAMTHTDMITFDNDAKSCYDRIVLLPAMLRSRQLGMPPEPCKLLVKFLEQAQYHVKTRLGVSENWYSSTESQPLHGCGQGSRLAPALWCMVSTLALQCLSSRVDGVRLVDPRRQFQTRRCSDGYVDDVTCWLNEALTSSLINPMPIEELVGRMRETAQWWEQLLWSTGGRLELPKCFYYILHWKFDTEGRASLATRNEMGLELEIRSSQDGSMNHIRQEDCQESHRTLGIQENPAGIYKAEETRLRQKGLVLARQIQAQALTRADAHVLYRSMYLPMMTYGLEVCPRSRKALEAAQSAPISELLSRMGYNSHMPRAVVFGPAKYGGLGLRHLYTEQGTAQTLCFIRHVRHGGQVGQNIRIALAWFQLIAGVSFSALEKPEFPLPYAEDRWFPPLRTFLAASDFHLISNDLSVVRPRREGDRAIMEDATEKGFCATELSAINRVRLFLQVECISDIVSAHGTHLQPGVLEFPQRYPPSRLCSGRAQALLVRDPYRFGGNSYLCSEAIAVAFSTIAWGHGPISTSASGMPITTQRRNRDISQVRPVDGTSLGPSGRAVRIP